jgi:hypothetical protein
VRAGCQYPAFCCRVAIRQRSRFSLDLSVNNSTFLEKCQVSEARSSHLVDKTVQACYCVSYGRSSAARTPRIVTGVTVGHPAYSIANQTNLLATAADAMQQLIIPNELKLGNRLLWAPGVVDLAPSCEQQAVRGLARGFRQSKIARLLLKEDKCRRLAT